MSGIVWQSKEEPAELTSSTKFLSFMIIHNFNVYFFHLRLLTYVGLFRQNGLILSQVFLYMERSKDHEKNIS